VCRMGREAEFNGSAETKGTTGNRVGCARLGLELLRAAVAGPADIGEGGVVEGLNYEALNSSSGVPAIEVIRLARSGAAEHGCCSGR